MSLDVQMSCDDEKCRFTKMAISIITGLHIPIQNTEHSQYVTLIFFGRYANSNSDLGSTPTVAVKLFAASFYIGLRYIESRCSWHFIVTSHGRVVRRIHRWPVNSPHKGPITRKMFSFDDVIMRRTTSLVDVCHFVLLVLCVAKPFCSGYQVQSTEIEAGLWWTQCLEHD